MAFIGPNLEIGTDPLGMNPKGMFFAILGMTNNFGTSATQQVSGNVKNIQVHSSNIAERNLFRGDNFDSIF